jgi:aromatic ring-opening dioxygenase LigB subunit
MRVLIVPGVLALRPEYASIEDPVADLRKAVAEATDWLGDGKLVTANGSAKRTEKAPGHFDDRAEPFDSALGAALRSGDLDALRGLDRALASELWADVDQLITLADGISEVTSVEVDYDDAPYGVQYWVVRYECAS